MPPADTLVLDAAPLITQPALVLMQQADHFYTTPGVHSELRDDQVQQQLVLWGDRLKIRQPKPESITRVNNFAKLTGDFAVLSNNDIHIIALAYELDVEANGGDNLRTVPQQKTSSSRYVQTDEEDHHQQDEKSDEDDGFQTVVRKKRNSRKPRRQPEPEPEPQPEPEAQVEVVEEEMTEADLADFDDGEGWITPDNIVEEMTKDAKDQVEDIEVAKAMPVAIATGDFACQNVCLQMGLSLLNYSTGKRITRLKNFMYRCHACFTLTPIPKDGKPKHFCPKCGGATLLRCTVLVDEATGKITPHLKRNFVYITRGQRYLVASPLLKNSQKKAGNRGYQHNKDHDELLLREDQREYQLALKHNDWERRQQDKQLQQWIGGGSADNYISPFADGGVRPLGVRVGRGRHLNALKKRK